MAEQPQQPADLSATLAAILTNMQHLQGSINSIHDENNKQNKIIYDENKKIYTTAHEQSKQN